MPTYVTTNSKIPKIKDICEDCGDHSAILQLTDSKEFGIFEHGSGSQIGSLDLSDFASPVDGHTCTHLQVTINSGEIELFNNGITNAGSPSVLDEGTLYVRGIMIKIDYPKLDNNGEEIDIKDKNVELWIEDAGSLQYKKHPMYNLFTLITNPKSNDPTQLINKIKIVNPNSLFEVKVNGLITFGKAEK